MTMDFSALLNRKRVKQRDKALSEASTDLLASGGDESVSVCIRLRPFNRRELEIHNQKNPDEFIRSVVEMPDGVKGNLRLLERTEEGAYNEVETFQFTRTFWSVPDEQQPHKYLPITQEDVFDVVGRMVLTNALSGYNVCVFAYGQTGSGKTHTMMGDFETMDGEFVGDPGLIPRLCRELFRMAEKKKADYEAENPYCFLSYDIKLSALEIYNEQVRDLFWKGSPFQGRTKNTILKIRVSKEEGVFVEKLTVFNPKTWEECIRLIAAGVAERSVAATLMNDESSRSHSVFQISIVETETVNTPPDKPYERPVVSTKTSRISLVDLAGSERLKKSGASGQQQKEAAGINLSLSTLKKVIDALVVNSTEKNLKKQILVPYRESALTQLLSHSLGGNSKTTMIACVSPHYDNQEETMQTLRYANRTKGIINKVKSNENNAEKQAKLLKDQVAFLMTKLEDGPAVYDESQRAELRRQLEESQAKMDALARGQREKEAEADRLRAVLQSHKNARFNSAYYNAFKRALLDRIQRATSSKVRHLQAEMHAVGSEKDHLSTQLAFRERSIHESEFAVDDFKRKDELFSLRSARHEALSRQLSKDINKFKQRADELLASRFGLIWLRVKQEKAALRSREDHRESMGAEHEQYLQSIIREAKKQFDLLISTYAEKRDARQERVDALSRGLNAAKAQLEKAQQLRLSVETTMRQSVDEYRRREEDKRSMWERRYASMQSVFEEKIAHLEGIRAAKTQQHEERVADMVSKAAAKRATAIEELEARLALVDADGERQLSDARAEMDAQVVTLSDKAVSDSGHSLSKLQTQFIHDEAVLLKEIGERRATLLSLRAQMQEHYDYAVQLEATTQRAESALTEGSRKGPTDYVLFVRDVESFVKRYRETLGPHDFSNFSAVLRQNIDM